ncbi:transmembrane protein 184A-like protein, partial [Tanacetum coccineum]
MGPVYYIIVALPCTIGAIALALVHIYRHLLNYTEPTYQRYIVRIIFMVPVYALMSFMSLVFNKSSIYFNSIREVISNQKAEDVEAYKSIDDVDTFCGHTELGLENVASYPVIRIKVIDILKFITQKVPKIYVINHTFHVVGEEDMCCRLADATNEQSIHITIWFPTRRRRCLLLKVVDRYEAWVIYNFLSLCLAWVGGPGAVVLSLTGRVLKSNWCLMTCCFPPIPLDGFKNMLQSYLDNGSVDKAWRFIRRCKQGCLQFVILKPILVAVTFVLYANGKYHDGNFSVAQSYLYLTIIYTISYSMALYALALFYMACRDMLQPFNPVPKFIIIKSVVFLTYWQ